MTVHLTLVLVALGLITSLGITITGIHIYRTYAKIGASAFAGFVITMGISSIATYSRGIVSFVYGGPIINGIDYPGHPLNLAQSIFPQQGELLFLSSVFVESSMSAISLLLWGVFVLRYTTRHTFAKRVLIVLLGWLVFGSLVDTIYITPIDSGGILGVTINFVVLLLVIITFGAMLAGSVQLYISSRRYRLLNRLTVGALLGSLWFSILGSLLISGTGMSAGILELVIYLTGTLLGLGSIWVAVNYCGIFDQPPISQTVGRSTAIETLDAAIVVFGKNRSITDFNKSATKIFDSTEIKAGDSIDSLLPETVSADNVWRESRTEFSLPNSNRIIEAETTVTTDNDGQELGRSIIFKDITKRHRRQQRIQVLNRVLRHNLRNELDVVSGYSQLLTDGGIDTREYAQKIDSQVTELVELGDTAREIEEILEADPKRDSPTRLNSLVDDTIGIVAANTGVSITTNIPDETAVFANSAILQPILREILENAIVHNQTGSPEINIMSQSDGASIVISDNGPGIPKYEIEVFESGRETPLEHGSGLGLWLVKWGVDRLGGTVSFETDSGGTRVMIQLPDTLVYTP